MRVISYSTRTNQHKWKTGKNVQWSRYMYDHTWPTNDMSPA